LGSVQKAVESVSILTTIINDFEKNEYFGKPPSSIAIYYEIRGSYFNIAATIIDEQGDRTSAEYYLRSADDYNKAISLIATDRRSAWFAEMANNYAHTAYESGNLTYIAKSPNLLKDAIPIFDATGRTEDSIIARINLARSIQASPGSLSSEDQAKVREVAQQAAMLLRSYVGRNKEWAARRLKEINGNSGR